MNDDLQNQLRNYASNASEQDIPRIERNIDGMKRGPVKKIWDDVSMLWRMVLDPRAAWSSKAIAVGALVYLISPLDVIPDVVPILGLTDDVGVIVAAVASLSRQLKNYRMKRARSGIPGMQPTPMVFVETGAVPPLTSYAPLPSRASTPPEDRLRKNDDLFRQQLITDQEYHAKRQQILSEI